MYPSKGQLSYCHHLVIVVVLVGLVLSSTNFYILIYFSQTTGPFGTKLGIDGLNPYCLTCLWTGVLDTFTYIYMIGPKFDNCWFAVYGLSVIFIFSLPINKGTEVIIYTFINNKQIHVIRSGSTLRTYPLVYYSDKFLSLLNTLYIYRYKV